ncbi:MAG: hypothetical protein ACOYMB_02220 [Patescibacteria group bacterium]
MKIKQENLMQLIGLLIFIVASILFWSILPQVDSQISSYLKPFYFLSIIALAAMRGLTILVERYKKAKDTKTKLILAAGLLVSVIFFYNLMMFVLKFYNI